MQTLCCRFWMWFSSMIILGLLSIFIVVGILIYNKGQTSGQLAGYNTGYEEGWYDRHCRDKFAKSMKCATYWLTIQKQYQDDRAKREERWILKSITQ